MIKEAIEKIIGLADPHVYKIGEENFTNDPHMLRVDPKIDRPASIEFSSLDAIVQAIKTELDRVTQPIFISICSHDNVDVFTTYRNDNMQRDSLYSARPVLPKQFREWSEHEDAIIMLRSQFIQNEGTAYLLDLLSRISSEDSVVSQDNGVSQQVSATRGVQIKQFENVKQRVLLAPFRTFLEVEQPPSEFIVRIKAGDKERGIAPQIGILEADGGAWKLAARYKIAEYFRAQLAELIAEKKVVVAE